MRYPVDNYKAEWDNHAGYDYGQIVSYGFHDGKDINDNGGGNSDLGKPLFAIAKGRVVGIHKHPTTGFGNHFFIQIDGAWGTRYVHYAHCLEISVSENQEVNEGQQIAKVGNSGTTYAHCHFAIKKNANGMDTVANTKAQLDDSWEDPIAFIEKYLTPAVNEPMATITQKELDEIRTARDVNWTNLQIEKSQNTLLVTRIEELKKQISILEEKIASTPIVEPQNPSNLNDLMDLEAIRKVVYDKWTIYPGKYDWKKQLRKIKAIYET